MTRGVSEYWNELPSYGRIAASIVVFLLIVGLLFNLGLITLPESYSTLFKTPGTLGAIALGGQPTLGGSLIMSVNQVPFLDQNTFWIVNAVANGGGNYLVGTESKTGFVSQDGKRVARDLEVDVSKTKDNCIFQGTRTTQVIKKLVEKQVYNNFMFSPQAAAYCQNTYPGGVAIWDANALDPFDGTVRLFPSTHCYAPQNVYSVIKFDQQSVVYDWAVAVTSKAIGGETKTLNLNNAHQQDITSDNKVQADWAGNLVSSQGCQPIGPGTVALETPPVSTTGNAGSSKLVDKGYFDSYIQDAESNKNTCFSTKTNGGGYNPDATNCVTQYNSRSTALFATSPNANTEIGRAGITYTTSAGKITLPGNWYNPSVRLKINALYLGIVEVKGVPQIVSCKQTLALQGGQTGAITITVKNVGNMDAQFSASPVCQTGVNVLSYPGNIPIAQNAQYTFQIPIAAPNANAATNCVTTIQSLNNFVDKPTCTTQVTVTQSTVTCTPPFYYDSASDRCKCPLTGQTPPAGQYLDEVSCTWKVTPTGQPTGTPTPSGGATVTPTPGKTCASDSDCDIYQTCSSKGKCKSKTCPALNTLNKDSGKCESDWLLITIVIAVMLVVFTGGAYYAYRKGWLK